MGHAWAGCSSSRQRSVIRVSAFACSTASCLGTCARRVRPHVLRDIPDVYGHDLIGWETLPEMIQRENRDLTLADILRLQHPFGQKPHESGQARRDVMEGIAIDRSRLQGIPDARRGAGLDGTSPLRGGEARRLARRHIRSPLARTRTDGLVIGETSFQQVADGVRAFLESHRL